METMNSNVVIAQWSVAGVPALGTVVRPWFAYVGNVRGVHTAPMAVSVLKQTSTATTPTTAATPRKDVFARSGIRTEGPPV